MLLEGVSMSLTAAARTKKTSGKKAVESQDFSKLMEAGVSYQDGRKENIAQPVPCETYNGMIKDCSNSKCPYEYLADESGNIKYNGVVFQCDTKHNALCLGNMEEEDKIITIPLSKGGVLKVNRDNIRSLGRAIGLFSPQDVRRILQALSLDAKIHSKKYQVEEQEKETYENLCKGAENNK